MYYKVVIIKKAKTVWNATFVSTNFKHEIIMLYSVLGYLLGNFCFSCLNKLVLTII